MHRQVAVGGSDSVVTSEQCMKKRACGRTGVCGCDARSTKEHNDGRVIWCSARRVERSSTRVQTSCADGMA